MNNEIRRKDRSISEEEARGVLEKGEYGFLATVGPDGQPYAIPLSFIVWNDHVYFHCAPAGRKLDNITANPAVCFTVVGATQPVYDDGSFGTYYESCMVFGKARAVTEETEKRTSLMLMAGKYLPEHVNKAGEAITKSWDKVRVYAISMDRVTGKSKRERHKEKESAHPKKIYNI